MAEIDKNRCEQYISIFENDTPKIQYHYCENIYDGRGYTSGRAGFCTGCGDALDVIQLYTSYKLNNSLAKYIPKLKKLKHGNGDVSSLKNYCKAWEQESKDQLFIESQNYINDKLYYIPAMIGANKMNIQTPLGKCSFYDTIIQHGGGDDEDSFHAIMNRTEKLMNGPVKIINEFYQTNELEWIEKFLQMRKMDLLKPKNHSYQSAWQPTVDRVNFLLKLLYENNWQMNTPIYVKTRLHDQIIE